MKPPKATFSVISTVTLGLLLLLLLILLLALTVSAALAAGGDLDPAFDGDGLVTTDFAGTSDTIYDIALRPDGKIVAAGTTEIDGDYLFSLARYVPDGSLDGSFSLDGRLTTNFTVGLDGALAVAVQPDGKIVAGGFCETDGEVFNALVRYNPDGSLDNTFGTSGTSGKVCGPWPVGLSEIVLQPDGKILASAYIFDQSLFDFSVYRFNSDGSIDTSFGDDGRAYASFSGLDNRSHDLIVQPDGKILVAGSAQVSGSNSDIAVARFLTDGTLDTQFGGDGMVTTDYAGGNDAANAIALSPDGRIYVAGTFSSAGQGRNFGLVRYLTNGDLDTSFDDDGMVDLPLAAGQLAEFAQDLKIQPTDGKVVAAGQASDGNTINFALVRVNTDGSLDDAFGTGGIVSHNFLDSNSLANSLALQSDGKFVTGGVVLGGSGSNNDDYALARYLADDTPTPTATATADPSITPTVCAIEFTDVPPGSTFYNFVHCIACEGVINGYDTGCETGNPCFRPNNNLTRGQLSKIVSNAARFTEQYATATFEDVPVGSTFHQFVERLADRSIISGYACGGVGEPCGTDNKPYVRPNNNVTRGQISKIVSEAVGLSQTASGQQFEDVAEGSTFYEWIWRLVDEGAMNGYACGGVGEPCGAGSLPYFRPGANATRGQASKVVANTFFPDCETPVGR